MYREIIAQYLEVNKEEKGKLAGIFARLEQKDEICLIDRKNFVGHFTASAFVVEKKSNKVLMIYHKILKRYLQPGGHVEKTDTSPLNAAKRELFEETGINEDLIQYRKANCINELIPLNISVHLIPENKAKNEKAHYHYDFQYLFAANDDLSVHLDFEEVNSFEWVDWDIFKEMPGLRDISGKIEQC